MNHKQIKRLLDAKVKEYNTPTFIAKDPISVPYQFSKKQDIEIAAFFAAILAWGNRTSIINSANAMDGLCSTRFYIGASRCRPKTNVAFCASHF